jgi:hypothetical protein
VVPSNQASLLSALLIIWPTSRWIIDQRVEVISMKKALIVLVLSVLGCGTGRKSTTEPNFPDPLRQALAVEVSRVEPLLTWRCDMPTEPNRTDCSGDGMSASGRVLLDGGLLPATWEAMKASIGSDGRPWRAPDRVERQRDNSFSRDGFIGLVEATISSGDTVPLQKVLAYAHAHENQLCPDATDDRCKLTQSVLTAAKYASRQDVKVAERALDENTILAEAHTAPATYRAYLVMRKLNIAIETGNFSPGYYASVGVLRKRFPQHPFVQFLAARADKTTFDGVVQRITSCLSKWEKPGTQWWGDAGYFSNGCAADSQGHELVALAKRLLR